MPSHIRSLSSPWRAIASPGSIASLLLLCVGMWVATTAGVNGAPSYNYPSEKELIPYDPDSGIEIPVISHFADDPDTNSLGLPKQSYNLEVSVDEKHRVKFNGLPLEKAKKKMSKELTEMIMSIVSAEESILESAVVTESGNGAVTYKVDIEKSDSPNAAGTSAYYIVRQIAIKADNLKMVEQETQRIYIQVDEDGSVKYAFVYPPQEDSYLELYNGANNRGQSEKMSLSDVVGYDHDNNYTPESNNEFFAPRIPIAEGGKHRTYHKIITRSLYAASGLAGCIFIFKVARRYTRLRQLESLAASSYMPLHGPSSEKNRVFYNQSSHSVTPGVINYETMRLNPGSVAQNELSNVEMDRSSNDTPHHTSVRITLKDPIP